MAIRIMWRLAILALAVAGPLAWTIDEAAAQQTGPTVLDGRPLPRINRAGGGLQTSNAAQVQSPFGLGVLGAPAAVQPPPDCSAEQTDLFARFRCDKLDVQSGRLSGDDYELRKVSALAAVDPLQIGFERALTVLKQLREQELISQADYERRRSEILELL
ncbi:MAG: SHOCT domain-containing protein [Alphaproteobacteria bacterium]|nr:SHOCT domain-containing protein [Alphaproteobacteria bacterium]